MPVNRAEWTHPDLQSLAGLFYENAAELGAFQEIQAEEMPQPYRKLLAHTNHMTVSMENHHQSPVEVRVGRTRVTANHYARQIVLTRQSDGAVVQFGIVRLNTSLLRDDVRREIETEQIPLGRILIDRDVMRNVKLMSCWQIIAGPVLKEAFQNQQLDTCYGRTALIYTDGVPAVELLEIAVDV